MKPGILAPGEKIISTIPGDTPKRMDDLRKKWQAALTKAGAGRPFGLGVQDDTGVPNLSSIVVLVTVCGRRLP
jgi:hypothetical protein